MSSYFVNIFTCRILYSTSEADEGKSRKVKKNMKKPATCQKKPAARSRSGASATPKTAAKSSAKPSAKSKAGAKGKPQKKKVATEEEGGNDDSTPAVADSKPKRHVANDNGGVQEKEPKKSRKAKADEGGVRDETMTSVPTATPAVPTTRVANLRFPKNLWSLLQRWK